MKIKLLLASLLLGSAIPASIQQCTADFKASFLAKANQLRQRHGVSPLTLDTGSLQEWAQSGADIIARENKFSNRQSNPYGENQGIYHGIYPSGELVVKNWYDAGASIYAWYGLEPDMRSFSQFGSFSQLIWRSTCRVGVGCVKTDGGLFVVATFDPIGNQYGRFAANVLRGSAGQSLAAESSSGAGGQNGGGQNGGGQNGGGQNGGRGQNGRGLSREGQNGSPTNGNNNRPGPNSNPQFNRPQNSPLSNNNNQAQQPYIQQLGPGSAKAPSSSPQQPQQKSQLQPGRVTPDPPSPPSFARKSRAASDSHLGGLLHFDSQQDKMSLGSMLRPGGRVAGLLGAAGPGAEQLIPLGQNVIVPPGSS